ncbi:hypothetical protein NC653_009262 [Populus alba x Populus x berolinensis]|uniref:Uncharacterized protein n=1 Tax=Populus alba x Populus x berolinensis TaxID=444605 RepID=A0AAD6R8Y7_9ROSI|nr:hypothetical protein NC653_009262 [Populus alba x Populus x berolinensis]
MAEDVTKDPIPVDMVEEGTKNHIPEDMDANESTLLGIGYDPRRYWNENTGVNNALAPNEDTLRRLTDCDFEVDNQVIANGVIH